MIEVEVHAGSRLHFGLLRAAQDAPRKFGGVGLMIARPTTVVRAVGTASRGTTSGSVSQLRVRGAGVDRLEQVGRHWQTRHAELAIAADLRGCQVPPSHTGLGVGTQLALCAATALTALRDCLLRQSFSGGDAFEEMDRTWLEQHAAEILSVAGRGKRSAVGSHGFFQGGLIWDAGYAEGESLGRLQQQVTVPEEWTVVLMAPHAEGESVSGAKEESHFHRCQASDQRTERLETLLRDSLIPAAVKHDFDAFAAAVTQYNHDAGMFFAEAQGGAYHGATAETLVRWVQQQGTYAVGQSSWGPTIFAVARNVAEAGALADRAAVGSIPLSVSMAPILNEPAKVLWRSSSAG